MEKLLEKAIKLRNKGDHARANAILVELAREFPEDAEVHYHCAWSFDLLGEEAQAAPFYENAIRFGLQESDLEGAYLGLGSTYRSLGEYAIARRTFLKGMEIFPSNQALKIFYSMTLYNQKEYPAAMELLLKCLVETTQNEDVLAYKNAILFYSDRLDEVWK